MNNKTRLKTKTFRLFCVFFWTILVFVLINGCGGAKKLSPSEFHKKEAGLSKKAKAAYEAGRYEKALFFYQEALKASRAVEDVDLIAINLINIAVVYRQMGD
ncbi:MAG: tetratricopeptide repeat protein, partial [Deltaproteobacteria bacterium]|nr:tetratricopeptide repeat protein [Deltaproteobacteria bacterium]